MKKVGFFSLVLVGFLFLLSLGFWQLHRLQEKEKLLEQLRQASIAPPLSLESVASSVVEPREFLFYPLTFEGVVEATPFYVIGRFHKGKAGYHVVAPLRLSSGKKVFINLGWVAQKNPKFSEKKIRGKGLLRLSTPGWFSPSHRPSKNEWGFVDIEAMAHHLNIRLLPFYVQVTECHPVFKDIKVEEGRPTLPNNHLGYALVWFTLAVFWIVGAWRGNCARRSSLEREPF